MPRIGSLSLLTLRNFRHLSNSPFRQLRSLSVLISRTDASLATRLHNPTTTARSQSRALITGDSVLKVTLDKRWTSSGTATAQGGKGGEINIKSVLVKAFPSAKSIIVEDISGGCGSMYQVHIVSVEFEGLSIVKQHQLVTKALKEEIQSMHGIRISTEVPKKE